MMFRGREEMVRRGEPLGVELCRDSEPASLFKCVVVQFLSSDGKLVKRRNGMVADGMLGIEAVRAPDAP